MIKNDPNIQTLELAAAELRPLLSELILVGGCAVSILITDRGRPPVRATIDVDLLAEVTPLSNYYALCARLGALGFKPDADVICRWTKGPLLIDIMSTDEKVLGFTNRWYSLAASSPMKSQLPSGIEIQHISAPFLIATKIDSFYGRGDGDFLHHDIEDMINLIDGRPEISEEIKNSPQDIQDFIKSELEDFLSDVRFVDSIPLMLHPDPIEQARSSVIIERLRSIAGL